MPLALQVDLSGSVTQPQTWGTIDGHVTTAGPSTHTILGTVLRDVVDAYDQPRGTGTFYYRVRLADEWIPESELAGALTVERHLDAHTVIFEFGLTGRRWSIFATERTWTRTPVEVHRWRGQSASEMLADEPLIGFVKSCRQAHQPEPMLRVRCVNSGAALFERSKVCLEVPPYSGKTRGQIIGEVLTAAGITDFDVPPGQRYDKPLQVIDEPLFDWLRGFAEPEGWKIRWRGQRLELYLPELRREPLPPDATWTADQWISTSATPAAGAPSLWILRGVGAVVVDELGIETTVTETEIVAPYAPKQVVSRQLSSGVIEPLNLPTVSTQDRVINRIVDTRTSRGGQLVGQVTAEYGWYNVGAAKLRSSTSTDDYDPLDVRIDPDGRYVRWLGEKFHQLTELRTTPAYDDDGNLEATRVESHGYHLRTIGVGNHGSTGVNVVGAWIHGDDQSYSERYEKWGRFEEQVITYEYDEATGARHREIQDTSRYYAPRVRVEGAPVLGWYRLYNGEAQSELVAQWRRVESIIKTQILAEDAAVAGDVETRFGFDKPTPKHDGFDWGGFKSAADEETFSFRSQKTVRFDRLNEDQIEVETREPGESPRRQTLLGREPLPAFRSSPWTRIRQEPLEVLVDDPVAEAWFGVEVTILTSDHVVSTSEALAMIKRARRRTLAHSMEVTRPVTFVDVAGTVEILDPPSGASGRGLAVSVRETWDMAKVQFLATYVVEIEL